MYVHNISRSCGGVSVSGVECCGFESQPHSSGDANEHKFHDNVSEVSWYNLFAGYKNDSISTFYWLKVCQLFTIKSQIVFF